MTKDKETVILGITYVGLFVLLLMFISILVFLIDPLMFLKNTYGVMFELLFILFICFYTLITSFYFFISISLYLFQLVKKCLFKKKIKDGIDFRDLTLLGVLYLLIPFTIITTFSFLYYSNLGIENLYVGDFFVLPMFFFKFFTVLTAIMLIFVIIFVIMYFGNYLDDKDKNKYKFKYNKSYFRLTLGSLVFFIILSSSVIFIYNLNNNTVGNGLVSCNNVINTYPITYHYLEAGSSIDCEILGFNNKSNYSVKFEVQEINNISINQSKFTLDIPNYQGDEKIIFNVNTTNTLFIIGLEKPLYIVDFNTYLDLKKEIEAKKITFFITPWIILFLLAQFVISVRRKDES